MRVSGKQQANDVLFHTSQQACLTQSSCSRPKDVGFANEKEVIVSRHIDVELRRECDVLKTTSRPINVELRRLLGRV